MIAPITQQAVSEYVEHYHGKRNHQGLSNELIEPSCKFGAFAEKIECRERRWAILVIPDCDDQSSVLARLAHSVRRLIAGRKVIGLRAARGLRDSVGTVLSISLMLDTHPMQETDL